MATFGNYPIKGSIKQGGLVGKVDFGTLQNATTLVWNLFLVVIDKVEYMFYQPVVNGTAGTIVPLTKEIVDNVAPSDFGKALPLVKLGAKPAIQFTIKGIAHVTSASDVYYTDGNGNFKADPYEEVSTSTSVKDILASLSTTSATGDATTVTKKWYQKPLTWVLTAVGTVVTIGIIVWNKNKN